MLVAGLALAGTPAFAARPPRDTPNRDDNPGVEHRPSETPPANQGTEHKPATPGPMASAELSRRVVKVVGYPPLSEMGDQQRRDFREALLDAYTFGDLPGKWQAAILKAEQSRPKLRLVGDD